MSNGFDKNEFQKAQRELSLASKVIAAIGVVSIVCSLFVGGGLFSFGGRSSKVDEDEQYEQFMEEYMSDDSAFYEENE